MFQEVNGNGQVQASSSGSCIGPMPTQTSNRLSYLTGLWKWENNVPLSLNYRENPGPVPGIINASSTILEAFFSWLKCGICSCRRLTLIG